MYIRSTATLSLIKAFISLRTLYTSALGSLPLLFYEALTHTDAHGKPGARM